MVRFTPAVVASLIAALGASPTEVSANGIPKKIDEDTALHLASEAIGSWSERSLEPEPYMSDTFFVFDGLNEPPRNGSFGFFAVNPWTGDIWALWGCHKLSSPALRRSQAAIRRRFMRRELKQYMRLARLKPECVFEDSKVSKFGVGGPGYISGLARTIEIIRGIPKRPVTRSRRRSAP